MDHLQGNQNIQAPQHPEDQKPQAPQYRSEVPPTHQYPPSNAAPAVGYPPQGPENPAQFSYQPPGAAGPYPPPSQDQHQAVPFPPDASPSNVPPAGYTSQGSEKSAQFSDGQPPGAAVAYPPPSQAQHQAVPFPPNALPSHVSPAGYKSQGSEKPAQFSDGQPPGAAVAYPPPSQAQHQAVSFPPNAWPSNTPLAGYTPQGSEKPGQCSYGQPPAVAFPPPPQGPQPQHHAVPLNAQQFCNVNQWAATAINPQPGYQGQIYQQHIPPTSGVYGSNLGSAQWTTGLFDCMEDPTNTLTTACFPCLTFGQIAEILDDGRTPCLTSGIMYGVLLYMVMGMTCILSCSYRTKLRQKYDLPESPLPDLLTHALCESCSLCQEYRELRNRGLDPGIGWQANERLQAQRQQQVATTPPVYQTMAAP